MHYHKTWKDPCHQQGVCCVKHFELYLHIFHITYTFAYFLEIIQSMIFKTTRNNCMVYLEQWFSIKYAIFGKWISSLIPKLCRVLKLCTRKCHSCYMLCECRNIFTVMERYLSDFLVFYSASVLVTSLFISNRP